MAGSACTAGPPPLGPGPQRRPRWPGSAGGLNMELGWEEAGGLGISVPGRGGLGAGLLGPGGSLRWLESQGDPCGAWVGSPGPGSAGRCGTYSGGVNGRACSIPTCPAQP